VSAAPADFNAQVIAEFRANGGHTSGRFANTPLLLLHTEGARSGTQYTTPVAYLSDGDRYVIFASKAGAPSHPGWYHNLVAHPDVTIEVGSQTLEATASVTGGAERERLFDNQVQAMPQFADYAKKTDRVIPVVVLTPKSS
jgi:deazaflavin-dependent oxidoreductase (nitroreductase family)